MDIKMDPIQIFLKQTGWSLKEAVVKLEQYKYSDSTKKEELNEKAITTKNEPNIAPFSDEAKSEVILIDDDDDEDLQNTNARFKSNKERDCATTIIIIDEDVTIIDDKLKQESEIIVILDDEDEKTDSKNKGVDLNYQVSLEDYDKEDTQPEKRIESEIKNKMNEGDDLKKQLIRELKLYNSRRNGSTAKPMSSSSLIQIDQSIQEAILLLSEQLKEGEIKIVKKSQTQEHDLRGYCSKDADKSREIVKKVKGLYRNLINTHVDKVADLQNESRDNSGKKAITTPDLVSIDVLPLRHKVKAQLKIRPLTTAFKKYKPKFSAKIRKRMGKILKTGVHKKSIESDEESSFEDLKNSKAKKATSSTNLLSAKAFPRRRTTNSAVKPKRLNRKLLAGGVGDRASVACNEKDCEFGRIYKRIKGGIHLRSYCKPMKCIFDCKCRSEAVLPPRTEILNGGVSKRFQDEANNNLGRVTQTVKGTQKDGNFNEEPYRSEKLDNVSIELQNHDCGAMKPYCMIYNLYRCPCLSQKQDYPAVSAITTPSTSLRKPFTGLQAKAQNGIVKAIQKPIVVPKLKDGSSVGRNINRKRKSKYILTVPKKRRVSSNGLTFSKRRHIISRTRDGATRTSVFPQEHSPIQKQNSIHSTREVPNPPQPALCAPLPRHPLNSENTSCNAFGCPHLQFCLFNWAMSCPLNQFNHNYNQTINKTDAEIDKLLAERCNANKEAWCAYNSSIFKR